jgi:hypothetical protein
LILAIVEHKIDHLPPPLAYDTIVLGSILFDRVPAAIHVGLKVSKVPPFLAFVATLKVCKDSLLSISSTISSSLLSVSSCVVCVSSTDDGGWSKSTSRCHTVACGSTNVAKIIIQMKALLTMLPSVTTVFETRVLF